MRRRLAIAAAAPLLLIGGAAVAVAAEPRPDNPGPAGRTAAVSIATPQVVQDGRVSFTGSGFLGREQPDGVRRGETISIKVDDGAIRTTSGTDVFATYVAGADGSLAGTVDLAGIAPATPLLPGRHWLRLLVGSGGEHDYARSIHADFTIVAPTTPTPTPGPAPGADPPAGGGSPTPTPAPGGAVAPPPVAGGNVTLVRTVLSVERRDRLRLALRSGGLGSAGTIRIRTKDRVKLGRGKKARVLVTSSLSYFVDPVQTIRVRLRLTKAGKALLRSRRSVQAVVEVRDASGEGHVDQPVVVRR